MFAYLLRHELRKPLIALAAASIAGPALLAARMVLTHRLSNQFLVWNVFLAWIPLLLALRLGSLEQSGRTNGWIFWATALAWLLFFPNAPYIFTDLNHLKPLIQSRWWSDLILILYFALIGLVLAFISLHHVQSIVAKRFGGFHGWAFVTIVAFLSGFGVYLGRFERWNTWDVVARPIALAADSVNWLRWTSLKFSILFGIFILTAYALLYSLTSLPGPAQRGNSRN